jgi:hypothetical protein
VSTWGRSSSDGSEPELAVQLEPVGSGGAPRRVIAGAVMVALLVSVLWLKPWQRAPEGLPIAGPEAAAASLPARPTQLPNPSVAPRPQRQAMCQTKREWRLLSIETSATWHTRTMYAATPEPADGPYDPDIPARRLVATTMSAVGLCAPETAESSATALLEHVRLWQVVGAGVVRLIEAPVILDQPLYETGEAYFTPSTADGHLWPVGRYVFEIPGAQGEGSAWMALDFVGPPD